MLVSLPAPGNAQDSRLVGFLLLLLILNFLFNQTIRNYTIDMRLIRYALPFKTLLGLGYARHHKQGTRKSLLLTHQAHIVADMVASVVLTLVERIHTFHTTRSSAQPWP